MLQQPLFNSSYPSFMNYGGIGFDIAREMVHAFDELGRPFDSAGLPRDWWNNATVKQYDAVKECVSSFYAKQNITADGETFKANADRTVVEDVADVVGLCCAAGAYDKNGDKIGDELVKQAFEGLNSKQLFFVAFAQSQCYKYDREYLPVVLDTSAISPAAIRVNGAVAQSSDFAEAFSCPSGSAMNPPNKCKTW